MDLSIQSLLHDVLIRTLKSNSARTAATVASSSSLSSTAAAVATATAVEQAVKDISVVARFIATEPFRACEQGVVIVVVIPIIGGLRIVVHPFGCFEPVEGILDSPSEEGEKIFLVWFGIERRTSTSSGWVGAIRVEGR